MLAESVLLAFTFGTLFGIIIGMLAVVFLPSKWFYDKVWIEVDSEYEINALEVFRYVKDMSVFVIPPCLVQKEGKTEMTPTRALFYFKRYSHVGDNEYSCEQWRRHLVGLLEKNDISPIASGVC